MKQSHIIVFLTDDHGAWAMPDKCEALHAPTLSWLQETGTTCTHAFSPNPVCSPARASFWSELIPSAHGVLDFISEGANGVGSGHPGMDERNLGQRLQEVGYHTIFTGKWHAGGHGKKQDGFDHWASMTCGTNARCADFFFNIDGEEITRHGYQALMITAAAVGFLLDKILFIVK
ncbi:MAG: sulfatase-like hydrolase/transferase [Lentisphaeria bacterium]|nr:sulfatase-like hydrolase/transferase [Lentisphaeria bacterium]NQZ70488.1 sulfatase-like hydrolase/transferase [Lentisphaeria bacterium]